MGVFGEAIYGHDGQYKARVYNAQYVRTADGRVQLAGAGGLTVQDALNRVFPGVSIGPQHDSAIILSLDAAMKGYSWAVRAARQTGSSVSGGYYHAVYSESTLSVLHATDNFLYFPFIPNGEYCISLLRDQSSFTAEKRWGMNMQSVPVMLDERNRELGGPLHLSGNLMRRLIPYIISQISVNARQYLYIRVPDQAPYEAYCLAVLHEILSLLPPGLRAGIYVATNSDPQMEQDFGILFQRSSFPARHATDIDLHRNAEYAFLNQIYISSSMKKLLEQFADYPELAEKCFRTMEKQVYGDRLPKSYQSYENYYGISMIQKDQKRPSYLEECGRLLESTSEPTLRAILERVILDEFRTSQDLDEAIQRDPAFEPVTSFSALTAYMKSRNSILSFLGEHGIHYSAMFLYGRLYSIASEAGVHNALDFYEKVVTERQELKGLREEEQKQILFDARDGAWQYFSRMRCREVEGQDAQAAANQYTRLISLDERLDPSARPPLSEQNWFNSYQRTMYLNQYRANPAPETASRILSIPEFDSNTGNSVLLTREGAALIAFTREMMEKERVTVVDPGTAEKKISDLIALEEVFGKYFRQSASQFPEVVPERNSFYFAYENALRAKAVDYVAGKEATGSRLAYVIRLAEQKMPHLGQECIQEIENIIAEGIRTRAIPARNRTDLYSAAAASVTAPELQEAYSDWVATELRDGTLEAEELQNLYRSVRNPNRELQALYAAWSDKKGLMESMKASRTLVKYLSSLIKARGQISAFDMKENRKQMWRQLTVQEKTISAFTASVAYLYEKTAVEVLQDPSSSRNSKILRDECNFLISDHGMGILLDPNLSISELYENVQQYCSWSNFPNVMLYTKRTPAESDAREFQDLDGRTFYAKQVPTKDLRKTLKYLLCILDGKDYSCHGEKDVDLNRFIQELLNNPSLKSILSLMETSRIIKNNSDLGIELLNRGYAFSTPTEKKSAKEHSSSRFPALAGAICVLTFILGAVISHFVWPGKAAETVIGKPPVVADNPSGPRTDEVRPPVLETDPNVNSNGGGNAPETDPGKVWPPVPGTDSNGNGNGGGNAPETDPGKVRPPVPETGPAGNSDAGGNDIVTTEKPDDKVTVEKEEEESADHSGTGKSTVEEKTEGVNESKLPQPNISAIDDDDRKMAGELMEQAITDNAIVVGENQVLLPVYGNVIDSYLILTYSRWEYKEESRQMVLKDPKEDIFIGYAVSDGNGKYKDPKILSYKDIKEIKKNPPLELPEDVRKKLIERNDSDTRRDLYKYSQDLKNYIDNECRGKGIDVQEVLFDGKPESYPFQ